MEKLSDQAQSVEVARLPSASDVFTPVMSVDTAVERYSQFNGFVSKILRDGKDFGRVGGSGKPTLLKPGAEKLCSFFGLHPSYTCVQKVERWDAATADRLLSFLSGSVGDSRLKGLPVGGRLAILAARFGLVDCERKLNNSALALRVSSIPQLRDLVFLHPAVAVLSLPAIAGALAFAPLDSDTRERNQQSQDSEIEPQSLDVRHRNFLQDVRPKCGE